MQVLAVHNDSFSWKIASVSLQEGGEKIEFLRTFRQEEHPLEALGTLFSGKTSYMASSIPAEQLVLRSINLDIRGWAHILKVLPFQLEDLIPFPKEQTLILAFLEKETAQGSLVNLVATQKSFVEKHLSNLAKHGIEPHAVTTTVHALKRWARYVAPKEDSLFLIYVSRESSFGIFLHKKEVACFKTFSYERRGEWLRVKEFLETQTENGSSLPWLVAGESELLGEEIPSLPVTKQLQEFAIPLGICLEALAQDGRSIQWRQEGLELPLQAIKKRKRQRLATALFLATAALLGPLGHLLLTHHQDSLLERAESALEKVHLPSKNMDFQDALNLLVTEEETLSREKQFGPYSPSLSLLLSRISQASLSIEKSLQPTLKTLRYHINALKQPSVEIEWSCQSVESAHLLRATLCRLPNMQKNEWRENKTILFTSFVIE